MGQSRRLGFPDQHHDAGEGNECSKPLIDRLVGEFGGQYDGVRPNATERDGGLVDADDDSVTRGQYRRAIGD